MRRGEDNLKDSQLEGNYWMQSEKRKKKLKCFEARIDGGDELPVNFDRTRLSTLDDRRYQETAILPCAKESQITRGTHSQHLRNEYNQAAMKQETS